MRILSLTYEYPPLGGGGSVVAASINETLVHFGDQVQVVTSAMPDLERNEIMGGVRVHRASCIRRHAHYTTAAELATTLLPAYRRAAEVIRDFRPEIIHTHFALPSGVVAARLSRDFGLPYVLTVHGSDIPGYNPDRFQLMHVLLRPLWQRIMRGASAIASPSHFLAELLREHIDLPVQVIPNGYSPAPRQQRPKRNLVLAVSRLFPRKGIQHFLDAVRGLEGDWEFIVAGDGPYMDALQRQARRLRSPVQFIGFIDRVTLRGLYEEARIMVFPSIRENFPMVLLEGMDAGCAVISTDAEGCAEVVGRTGITVDRESPVQIRMALERLMARPEECASLGAAARERARQFRWPVITNQYRELFAGVLGVPADMPAGVSDLAETGLFQRPKLDP
jgi:glycosyltransferase involved in cell wall biosynthesis